MEVQAEGGSLEVLGEGGADLLDKVGEAQWGLSERCTLDKAPSYSVWGLGQESVWGVRSVDSWPPAVGLVLTPYMKGSETMSDNISIRDKFVQDFVDNYMEKIFYFCS